MTHREAIALLDKPALRALAANAPQRWADLGCGAGTFTLALAHFLPPQSHIDAIDLHPGIPRQTISNNVIIQPRAADFTSPGLGLGELDGILMANALHYVADKPALLQTLHAALKPGALFLLVEYDTDTPVARWVPFPLSFAAATRLFAPPHWQVLQKGNMRPSAFGRSMLYASLTSRI